MDSAFDLLTIWDLLASRLARKQQLYPLLPTRELLAKHRNRVAKLRAQRDQINLMISGHEVAPLSFHSDEDACVT